MRGDGRSGGQSARSCWSFSPHAWGRKGFRAARPGAAARFPHMRGDGRAWGWPEERSRRVFPTCGGTEGEQERLIEFRGRFPHLRGDGRSAQVWILEAQSFSPHAWGRKAAAQSMQAFADVFPTCVGTEAYVRPPDEAGLLVFPTCVGTEGWRVWAVKAERFVFPTCVGTEGTGRRSPSG